MPNDNHRVSVNHPDGTKDVTDMELTDDQQATKDAVSEVQSNRAAVEAYLENPSPSAGESQTALKAVIRYLLRRHDLGL